jgi:hypothetical protein
VGIVHEDFTASHKKIKWHKINYPESERAVYGLLIFAIYTLSPDRCQPVRRLRSPNLSCSPCVFQVRLGKFESLWLLGDPSCNDAQRIQDFRSVHVLNGCFAALAKPD